MEMEGKITDWRFQVSIVEARWANGSISEGMVIPIPLKRTGKEAKWNWKSPKKGPEPTIIFDRACLSADVKTSEASVRNEGWVVRKQYIMFGRI